MDRNLSGHQIKNTRRAKLMIFSGKYFKGFLYFNLFWEMSFYFKNVYSLWISSKLKVLMFSFEPALETFSGTMAPLIKSKDFATKCFLIE
jgi:hypothetical protein